MIKNGKAYEVKRAFNNNIVLVDDDKKEIILFAKGIGFNCKKGSIIPENTNIEKYLLYKMKIILLTLEELLEVMMRNLLLFVKN